MKFDVNPDNYFLIQSDGDDDVYVSSNADPDLMVTAIQHMWSHIVSNTPKKDRKKATKEMIKTIEDAALLGAVDGSLH